MSNPSSHRIARKLHIIRQRPVRCSCFFVTQQNGKSRGGMHNPLSSICASLVHQGERYAIVLKDASAVPGVLLGSSRSAKALGP
ncbi:hypothetical protein CEXT_724411 [Caerostris extrusa]|uniref:Ribosomal protein L14 n=1 Tax=Caerostris extrusa TaxID=172846 RepID=A0AAV4N2P3_CAEEX|nr:hypothetical protein CEXT_724411 [Caerostris extrusa]